MRGIAKALSPLSLLACAQHFSFSFDFLGVVQELYFSCCRTPIGVHFCRADTELTSSNATVQEKKTAPCICMLYECDSFASHTNPG